MHFTTISLITLFSLSTILALPASHPRAITTTSTDNEDGIVGINAIGRAIAAIGIIEDPTTTTTPEVGINAIGRAIASNPTESTIGLNDIGGTIGVIPAPSPKVGIEAIGRAVAYPPSDDTIKPNAIGRAIAAIAYDEDESTAIPSPTVGIEAIGKRAIAAIGTQPTGVEVDAIGRRAIGAIGTQPTGVTVNAIGRRAIAAIGAVGDDAEGEKRDVEVDAIGK
ncbi:hypothetical protein I302_106065 [Kwoniella bestiolae CBS 10118]|uniref:Uncharacterized protein n=1 Tax=Kwoniella bestiolae CBS 10118 TaxID=1296100 RepID=A0A1B9G2Z4_9TREE|nr:hypothetical protein I302_05190 [Kwoniella bestiolae CBS 10118]OCF25371.1 hypothetical protein I302_05190 [Kwoniella bestiolae CBS 10118]